MRKNLALYRLLCAALAFCLGLTALCLPVFAEGETRQVILKYDSSMGSVAVNSTRGETAALAENSVWTPSKGIAQGEEVDNARSGASSKDFRTLENYTDIVNNISAGDYLIIQFGHNDSKADDPDRYTDPTGDVNDPNSYKYSLMQYIDMAFEKGAYPILATSVSRKRLSDAGLEQYVNAAKELGEELGIPTLDMYAKTNGWINKISIVENEDNTFTTDIEMANDLFNIVKPYDSRFVNSDIGDFRNSKFYASGDSDNTHLNYYGALLISQWACEELERINHPLTEKFSGFSYSEDELPSYADATSVE